MTLDRLYATEEREGGTPALGIDVPGIARDHLAAYPIERWEAVKDRLIHETWVTEAKARAEKGGQP